jgi:hypothetical protein
MSGNKKQDTKNQEQPAEQQPEGEPVRPMAVHPPTAEERIEALEIRLKLMEEFATKHNRYHFGGTTGP